MGDEEIGEEGREKIEEEYKYHNLHGIERGIEVFRVFDILLGGDEAYDIGIVYEEERSNPNPEDEKNFVSF